MIFRHFLLLDKIYRIIFFAAFQKNVAKPNRLAAEKNSFQNKPREVLLKLTKPGFKAADHVRG